MLRLALFLPFQRAELFGHVNGRSSPAQAGHRRCHAVEVGRLPGFESRSRETRESCRMRFAWPRYVSLGAVSVDGFSAATRRWCPQQTKALLTPKQNKHYRGQATAKSGPVANPSDTVGRCVSSGRPLRRIMHRQGQRREARDGAFAASGVPGKPEGPDVVHRCSRRRKMDHCQRAAGPQGGYMALRRWRWRIAREGRRYIWYLAVCWPLGEAQRGSSCRHWNSLAWTAACISVTGPAG
jgi:hypothetical protein